jgi:hypothetical protein
LEKQFHSFNRALIRLVAGAWFLCMLMSPFAGTAVAQSVKLSWNPSSSISGYNVYRTELSRVYGSVPINGHQLVTESSFTDLAVQHNRTYYYAVSAVNRLGVEGGLSAEIRVVVDPRADTTVGSASFLPASTRPLIERVPSDPDVSWGVFPWLVVGGGGIWGSDVMDGFEMALVVQNKSGAEASFRVETFDANGNRLRINSRSVSSEAWEQTDGGAYSLAASGADERVYAVSSGEVTTGMMTFQTSRAADGTPDVEPFLVYRVKKGGRLLGETFVELGFPETCSRYFAQRRVGYGNEGFESAIAMANLNSVPANATLTLRDQTGTAVERQTRVIPPGGHLGEMLAGIFQNVAGNGSLEVTSDVGLVTTSFNLFLRGNGDYTFLTIPRSRCAE